MSVQPRSKRVCLGFRLLTNHLPDWQNNIDLGSLDLNDSGTCILGQLYGSFQNGAAILGLCWKTSISVGLVPLDELDAAHLLGFWIQAITASLTIKS